MRTSRHTALTAALSVLLPLTGLAQSVVNSDLQLETVVTGLSAPTTMAFLGPDDFLVLQKNDGKVRRVVDGVLLPDPALDVAVNSTSERGLLGIAINTEQPPAVFLFYTEADGADDADPLFNRVYRYRWNPDSGLLEDPALILDLPVLPGANHDGGIVVLGPPPENPAEAASLPGDGAPLYVVIGDLNRNGQLQNNIGGAAPDDSSVILKVDQDGLPYPGFFFQPYCSTTTWQTCASDGDCPGAETCRTEVASYFGYGIRNSFGMALDPVTGLLWDTENGPTTDDEVNLVAPGFNSGWRDVMGLFGNETGPAGLWDVPGAGNTYSEPEFTWVPTIAPTAILFPVGSVIGEPASVAADDIALVADNNPGKIYAFPLDGNREAFDFSAYPDLQDREDDTGDESDPLEFATGFGAITDLKIGPDGALYIVSITFGSVYRVMPTDLFARAGPDREVAPECQLVQLGGSPTATGGSPPYSFDWDVTGVADVDWELSDNTSAAPTIVFFMTGMYFVSVDVTDSAPSMIESEATIDVVRPLDLVLDDIALYDNADCRACQSLVTSRTGVAGGESARFESPSISFGPLFSVADGATLAAAVGVPEGCP